MLHMHLMRLTNKFPRFLLGGLLSFVLFHPMFSISLRIGSFRAKFLLYLILLSILNHGFTHGAGYFHGLLVHFLEATISISYYYLFHFASHSIMIISPCFKHKNSSSLTLLTSQGQY